MQSLKNKLHIWEWSLLFDKIELRQIGKSFSHIQYKSLVFIYDNSGRMIVKFKAHIYYQQDSICGYILCIGHCLLSIWRSSKLFPWCKFYSINHNKNRRYKEHIKRKCHFYLIFRISDSFRWWPNIWSHLMWWCIRRGTVHIFQICKRVECTKESLTILFF